MFREVTLKNTYLKIFIPLYVADVCRCRHRGISLTIPLKTNFFKGNTVILHAARRKPSRNAPRHNPLRGECLLLKVLLQFNWKTVGWYLILLLKTFPILFLKNMKSYPIAKHTLQLRQHNVNRLPGYPWIC